MQTTCVCCDGKLAEVISLGEQPLANKYPKSVSDFDAEFSHEMLVFLCADCGYCHIPCEANREVFFEDYYYLSSVNQELVSHFTEMANELARIGAKFVLDVGSNDGILLKPLKELGVHCIGVDPSRNVGEIANKNGLETFIGFFDDDIADRVRREKGCPDVIVASSVFTHLEDPGHFFSVCDQLLDKDGKIIIEVEFLNDIIESFGFERFYYDRPHYYTLESLKRLGLRYGFVVVGASRINVHGGSIRVSFKRVGESDLLMERLQGQMGFLGRDEIINHFEDFKRECTNLKNTLKEFKNNSIDVVGYGCPARFSTITNFADIGPDLLPFVIDDSPLKQSRYSPGKHVPIIPWDGAPSVSTYLVFAYEYINSIRSKVSRSDVKFFQPIPFKEL
ncbi:class I SAM-dependent methyltransferase [Litoricolaceae bacterium]|nr:class I SAM-dependent methyltransferase [Litorivicinaceae bacterium]